MDGTKANPVPLCWLIRSPDVPSTVALGQGTLGRSPRCLPRLTGLKHWLFTHC
jgi:hypothetical protein